MFALVATSMAGDLKEKRGLLPSNELQAPAQAPFVPSQPLRNSYGTQLSAAAPSSYAVPAPVPAHAQALPAQPLPQALPAQALQTQVQNTQSVERINVPQPYPVQKTIVKTIGFDRPIPQVNTISISLSYSFIQHRQVEEN